jgi:hypothetical protein
VGGQVACPGCPGARRRKAGAGHVGKLASDRDWSLVAQD